MNIELKRILKKMRSENISNVLNCKSTLSDRNKVFRLYEFEIFDSMYRIINSSVEEELLRIRSLNLDMKDLDYRLDILAISYHKLKCEGLIIKGKVRMLI